MESSTEKPFLSDEAFDRIVQRLLDGVGTLMATRLGGTARAVTVVMQGTDSDGIFMTKVVSIASGEESSSD